MKIIGVIIILIIFSSLLWALSGYAPCNWYSLERLNDSTTRQIVETCWN